MDLTKVKLFIKDQFPEFYREEFPQFVEFVTKYYEYLGTTDYSLMDSVKDIDNSLDEYISVLKKSFAINIPEFGKLSDRDFLLFAKQFYTSKGSQDSYRFLFRAMYGKEIDILYPGDSVLKPSDGIWNQELSIRISAPPVSHTFSSGNTVTLNVLELTGKSFELISSEDSKVRIECIRINPLKNNKFDLFISRNYSGKIELSESFIYSKPFQEYNQEGQLESVVLTLNGTVLPIPSKIEILQSGSGFVDGTLFSIPSETPLKFRIKKVDTDGKILYTEIIQPGFDTNNVQNQFYIIDSTNRNFLNSNSTRYSPQTYCSEDYFSENELEQYARGDEFYPTLTQSLCRVEFGSILTYPGFYTSSKGFLSDAIKLQDNDYYQSFSYVIRLDEQLESYKNVVKRLLHPAGMSLWAEYNISSNIDIKATISTIIELLRLFVEDDVIAPDEISFEFSLDRFDAVEELETVSIDVAKSFAENVNEPPESGYETIYLPQNYVFETDYFEEGGNNAYIGSPELNIDGPLDSGFILKVEYLPQSYTLDSNYFEGSGDSAYSGTEAPVDIKILHPWKVRPVNDEVTLTESFMISQLYEFNDSVSSADQFIFEQIFRTTDSVSNYESTTITHELQQSYTEDTTYFLEVGKNAYASDGTVIIDV